MSTTCITRLPVELLQEIFLLSDNPEFAAVCRTFRNVVSHPSIKATWLVQRCGGDCQMALIEGQKWKFFDTVVLDQLDLINYQKHLKAGNNNPPKYIMYQRRPLATRLFKENDVDGRNYELVKILLERGASPDYPSSVPIYKSLGKGNMKMVKLLLEHHAQIHKLALKLMVKMDNYEIAALLLERGYAVDEELLTIAVKRENWVMVDLLKRFGAKPDNTLMKHYESVRS
jgi:hypothetical protein